MSCKDMYMGERWFWVQDHHTGSRHFMVINMYCYLFTLNLVLWLVIPSFEPKLIYGALHTYKKLTETA